MPTGLSLDPNPEDVTELTFSWVVPADTLAGVPLTYAPAISGLSFNITNVTVDTSITFSDNDSLDCQSHTFSVSASNAAGEGPVASITETIPIC